MEIDGFGGIINHVYIAKMLMDNGQADLARQCLDGPLDYDCYFENMYCLCTELSDFYMCSEDDRKNCEVQVHSSNVLMEFVALATAYRRKMRLSKKANPYFEEAKKEAAKHFNFSYCLDWILVLKENPQGRYASRLVLLMSYDDYVDLGGIAYGLIRFYQWLREQCEELRTRLAENEVPGQNPKMKQEVMAA